jgi:Domain of unknown function (DUF4976)
MESDLVVRQSKLVDRCQALVSKRLRARISTLNSHFPEHGKRGRPRKSYKASPAGLTSGTVRKTRSKGRVAKVEQLIIFGTAEAVGRSLARSELSRAVNKELQLSHVDLAPTLLALCGLTVPNDMQGTDLSGVLLGWTVQGPESAFFQIFVPFAGDESPHPWRGVWTDRYMYARSEAGPWMLYDLREDPYELKNLAHDLAQAALRDEMQSRLAGWMSRTGDSWASNSMAPVEDKGRLYRFETFYTIREYLDWEARHPGLAPRD